MERQFVEKRGTKDLVVGSVEPQLLPIEAAIKNLKRKWLISTISLAAAILFGVAAILFATIRSDQVSFLVTLSRMSTLVAAVYAIACIFSQLKAVRLMKVAGLSATRWYCLVVLGVLFLGIGTLVETGVFLAYSRRLLRKLRPGASAELAKSLPPVM